MEAFKNILNLNLTRIRLRVKRQICASLNPDQDYNINIFSWISNAVVSVKFSLFQVFQTPGLHFFILSVLFLTGGVISASSGVEMELGSGPVSAPIPIIQEDVLPWEPPVVWNISQEGSTTGTVGCHTPPSHVVDSDQVPSESPEMGPSRWDFWLGVVLFLGTVALGVWLATSGSGGGGGATAIDPTTILEGSVEGSLRSLGAQTELSTPTTPTTSTAVRQSSGSVVLRDVRVVDRADTPVLLPGHPPRIRYHSLGLQALNIPLTRNTALIDFYNSQLASGITRNIGLVHEQLGLRAAFTALSLLLDASADHHWNLRDVENYHLALVSVFRQLVEEDIPSELPSEEFLRLLDRIARQLHPNMIETLSPHIRRVQDQIAAEELSLEAIRVFWDDLIRRYPYLAADRILFQGYLNTLVWGDVGIEVRERIDYARFLRLVENRPLLAAANTALQELLLVSPEWETAARLVRESM